MEDTIVALATAAGEGAIGIIRLSGPKAISICNDCFSGKDLAQQSSHTIHFGNISKGDQVIDEVLVSVFKAPNSYTKEDVIEVSCHGSRYIQEQIIQLFLEKGARLAKPGEFTLRAFLHGRMDLSQAEAVADLIASTSSSSHDIAMKQMRGGFSNKIKELRQQLVNFASLIELELDFGEEDVEFANRPQLINLIQEMQQLIHKLTESFKLGNVIRHGVTTVIAGRPNAGKSTLLNTLLQEERAIVSEIAGTTRDTIEELLNINGITFRLIDTAGIRDASDKIEKIGIQKTMEKIESSAIVLYIYDVTEMNSKEVKEDIQKLNLHNTSLLLVGNKIDLAKDPSQLKGFDKYDMVFISSKNENNIDALKKKLEQLAVKDKSQLEGVVINNIRHYDLLQKSDKALAEVLTGLQNNTQGDILALDIKRALHYLGEITGEITTDELLGNIFGKFCIGK